MLRARPPRIVDDMNPRPDVDDRPAPHGALPSWRAGPARRAVLEFVEQVRGDGDSGPVPAEQRVAVFDNDGTLWCEKPMPIRIWNRVGRRPLLAAGNSNGDRPMLDFTRHADRPFLRLLVLHDDAVRELAYTAGAEKALEQAERDGWTVVSMKNDWAAVF
jgi:hypothetical protein